MKIESAHVVKPVGEFNKDYPDVTGHRQDHLAHVLSLALFVAAKLESADFGYAVNYLANFIPKEPLQIIQTGFGVFEGVVKQSRGDAEDVQSHLCQNAGHFQRMHQVGFTGKAHLSHMNFG